MTDQQIRLSVVGLTHRYGDQQVLTDVNLDVMDGEFLTFLGPSGCGKTTTLRAIAGFLNPTEGQILLDGEDITGLPPYKRPVNMVFQQSTLFPHLNVARNIAFGLKVAKVPKNEIDERVAEALAMVRLEGFGHRRPTELSGGQRQRINLARALVNRPKVLLLDEPLSALDLKIRLEMEAELRRLHRELGSTFIYVTHDQREALALSDRIAVFNAGRVVQLDSAETIYRKPNSEFSASFVGDANVFTIDVASHDGDSVTTTDGLRLPISSDGDVLGPHYLVVRPEDVRFGPAGGELGATVTDAAFRGAALTYQADCPALGTTVKAEIPDEYGENQVGDEVTVSWNADRARILPVVDHQAADAEAHATPST